MREERIMGRCGVLSQKERGVRRGGTVTVTAGGGIKVCHPDVANVRYTQPSKCSITCSLPSREAAAHDSHRPSSLVVQ